LDYFTEFLRKPNREIAMIKTAFLVLTLVTGFSLSALADGPKIGPNKGQIRDAGMFHLELVAANGRLTVFVTDGKHRPVATDGASATAIVLSGKKHKKISLKPASKNVLRSGESVNKSKNMKVVVQLKMPGQKRVQARFSHLP
jgi:hypothetical protein